MGIYPRVVAVDTVFFWDHVLQRLPRGLVMDVQPGSALEAAIGADRLSPLAAHSDVPVRREPNPTAVSNQSYEGTGGGTSGPAPAEAKADAGPVAGERDAEPAESEPKPGARPPRARRSPQARNRPKSPGGSRG